MSYDLDEAIREMDEMDMIDKIDRAIFIMRNFKNEDDDDYTWICDDFVKIYEPVGDWISRLIMEHNRNVTIFPNALNLLIFVYEDGHYKLYTNRNVDGEEYESLVKTCHVKALLYNMISAGMSNTRGDVVPR